MIRSEIMKPPQARVDWFDRLVAAFFATIIVLGVSTVALALIIYFPGANGSNVPLP
jgi:multisubunit Na+/H+ antiporter MnhC subunit